MADPQSAAQQAADAELSDLEALAAALDELPLEDVQPLLGAPEWPARERE